MLNRLNAHRALQIFQVLRLSALLFISILLAKSRLDLHAIGSYEGLVWIGTTLTFFWLTALLQSLVVLHSRKSTQEHTAAADSPPSSREGIEQESGVLLFNTFVLLCAASLLLLLLLCVFPAYILQCFTGQTTVPAFYYAFCFAFFMGVPAYLTEYIYLLHRRPKALLWWGIVSFTTQVLCFYGALQLSYGLWGVMLIWCCWSFLRLAWTLRLVFLYSVPRLSAAILYEQLHFTRPLAISMLAGQFILFFDNWLVQYWYQDASVFALYRYGARELPFTPALTGALTASVIPVLHLQSQKGLLVLRREGARLMHLLFPLTIACLMLSPTLFPLVFNRDFSESAALFNIYLLIAGSRLLLPGSILLASGHTKFVLYSSLIELTVKIAAGFLFIQWWGLIGVAWSAFLCYWVEKLAQTAFLYHKCGITPVQWLSVRVYGFYTSALLLVWFLVTFWSTH